MPADEQISNKNKNREKWPYYEIEENFMEAPNYRKDVG